MVVAQAACNAAVVAPGELRFPLAGNEALLQIKPGAALIGQRADPAHMAAKGNNVFGFLRTAKEVKQEGAEIAITTAKARLQNAVLGAAQVGEFAPGPKEFMELDGIDVSLCFGAKASTRRTEGMARRKAAESDGGDTRRGALKIADFDQKFALHGIGDDFSLSVANVSKTFQVKSKGKFIDIEIGGEAKLVGSLEFRPTFRGAVAVEVTGDWWPPN